MSNSHNDVLQGAQRKHLLSVSVGVIPFFSLSTRRIDIDWTDRLIYYHKGPINPHQPTCAVDRSGTLQCGYRPTSQSSELPIMVNDAILMAVDRADVAVHCSRPTVNLPRLVIDLLDRQHRKGK